MRPGQTVATMVEMSAVGCATIAAACLAACTSATGGAAELSWRLKPAAGFDDSFVDCNSNGELTDSHGNLIAGVGPLTAIRLYWQVGDTLAPPNGSAMTGSADFRCSTENGVTSFEIPPGDALLYVTPVCATEAGTTFEAQTCTYTAPAAVERPMVAGQVVQLGALEVIVDVGQGSAAANTCSTKLQSQCICRMPIGSGSGC